ncbi:hypothetical protein QO002_002919 [Pararhizobium capsulatum DSM 1112]|uniref:Uncharacterized protein n=1 Tax=Pararhizobium capsulatum DSM 1112 TaxID=1121113 RepID=A0ABU0BSZ3_9HYPH|nr:hypothetical protein [Pararhizobium capsulatum]MDQ0320781.1 hypothetical protein [Pararhizobium capsulatum DSM 1112]
MTAGIEVRNISRSYDYQAKRVLDFEVLIKKNWEYAREYYYKHGEVRRIGGHMHRDGLLSRSKICRVASILEAWLDANPERARLVQTVVEHSACKARGAHLSLDQKMILVRVKKALIKNERIWQAGQLELPMMEDFPLPCHFAA